MSDDLNQRVQERLDELEATAGSYRHDVSDAQHQLMWFLPPYGLSLVTSWRKRWGRHQPLTSKAGLRYCAHCGVRTHTNNSSLCADARAILEEVGVEP